jgi:hypothetical protein
MASSLPNDASKKASTRRLIAMGLLTVWFPYIFVWFIQSPAYPKSFRLGLTAWAVIWVSAAILFFAINITGFNPRG